MQKRARTIGAQLDITSRPGETRITLLMSIAQPSEVRTALQ
jgi:signal transduction histidine kinase